MCIESVILSSQLILCHPLLLLPSIFPSIRIFCNESALHIRWLKYWSFSFSINPSNEYSGLISSRMDWLDLLAVQGSLKSLLQHHNSKESIIWHSEPLTSYAKEIGWENYLAASIGNFIMEMKVWFEELSHSKPLPQEENKSLTFFLIKKIFLIPTNTCVTGFQIYYGLVKVIHQLLQL